MKVLFLDVDGVLNSGQHRACQSGGLMGMAREHVAELHRIVATTGCKIVVSSTWRIGGIGASSRFRAALRATDPSGLIVRSVIGATPTGKRRRDEILWWLNQDRAPHADRCAILDDDPSSIVDSPRDCLAPDMFATSFATGLTAEIADRVIEHLGRIT